MSTNTPTTPELELKPAKDINIINKRLEDLRRNGHNHLVGPGVKTLAKLESLRPEYEIHWHAYKFDLERDFYREKRWDAGQYALKGDALRVLWCAADGRIDQTMRMDDGKDSNYCLWTWGGKVLTLSGLWESLSLSKESDLRDGSAKAKTMATASGAMLQQQRADIVTITESKAMNRVLRALLGIKPTYTAEECQWPFILMKLVFTPNMADPMTKLLVMANHFGSMNALFGNAELVKAMLNPVPTADEPQDFGRQIGNGTGDQRQIEVGVGISPTPAPQGVAATVPEGPTKEDRIRDFSNSTSAQQIGILDETMKTKGYSVDKLAKPLAQFSEKNRNEFFRHLVDMPDKVVEEELPFKL